MRASASKVSSRRTTKKWSALRRLSNERGPGTRTWIINATRFICAFVTLIIIKARHWPNWRGCWKSRAKTFSPRETITTTSRCWTGKSLQCRRARRTQFPTCKTRCAALAATSRRKTPALAFAKRYCISRVGRSAVAALYKRRHVNSPILELHRALITAHEHLGRGAAAKKGIGLFRTRLSYSFGVCDRADDRLLCWCVLGFSAALGTSARYVLAGENAFARRSASAGA